MKTAIKLLLLLYISIGFAQNEPLRVGVVGLTHTHVHWILGRADIGDIEIVGIVEPNRALAARYAKQHGFSLDLVFDSMEAMIAETKPEAVTAFGTIKEHLEIVAFCAPLGIHVMVEKPLAVSLDHAKKMKALAQKYQIHLLTNYETTWYPTTHRAKEIVTSGKIGELKKVIVRDGHRGPVKLGINQEFLDWLLDPEQNGAGALTDFGCYGANLMTWLNSGERPLSVTAITQQLQKSNNPKVDDEAMIILTYENSTALIQASWNWPIGRKDMELYGLIGAAYADNRHDFRIRMAEGYDQFKEEAKRLEELPPPYNDPFSLFAAVIKGTVKLDAYDLSSLENNMLVMEILEAAKESAKNHRTVFLEND